MGFAIPTDYKLKIKETTKKETNSLSLPEKNPLKQDDGSDINGSWYSWDDCQNLWEDTVEELRQQN